MMRLLRSVHDVRKRMFVNLTTVTEPLRCSAEEGNEPQTVAGLKTYLLSGVRGE